MATIKFRQTTIWKRERGEEKRDCGGWAGKGEASGLREGRDTGKERQW